MAGTIIEDLSRYLRDTDPVKIQKDWTTVENVSHVDWPTPKDYIFSRVEAQSKYLTRLNELYLEIGKTYIVDRGKMSLIGVFTGKSEFNGVSMYHFTLADDPDKSSGYYAAVDEVIRNPTEEEMKDMGNINSIYYI